MGSEPYNVVVVMEILLAVQMGRRQSIIATLSCLHTGTKYTRCECANREPELVPLYRKPRAKKGRKIAINAVSSYSRADE